MKQLLKCTKGAISVMLSILLTGVLSVSLLIVEGGRYQLAKQELEDATLTSALSLLADYNSDLQSRFGLYGINDESKKDTSSFKNYMTINSNNSTEEGYAVNNISKMYNLKNTESEYMYDLANYQVLKRQMLEYNKYRTPIDITEELLDIDKMISELSKTIDGIIPNLGYVMAITDSIADIWTALKDIYTLEKRIAALQLSIDKQNESFADKLNEAFEKGWKFFDEAIGKEDWNVANPTYVAAYEALEKAINDKASYMSTHDAPELPVMPSSDLNSATNSFNAINAVYKESWVLYKLLDGAIVLGFCDSNGIVEPDKQISDLIDRLNRETDYFSSVSFGISSSSTRDEFFDAMNIQLGSIIGEYSEMTSYTSDALQTSRDYAKSNFDSISPEREQKYNAYLVVKAEWDEYYRKKQEYDEYQQKIKKYNETIVAKRDAMKSTASTINSDLGKYRAALNSVAESLTKAITACKTISENADQLEQIRAAEEANANREHNYDPVITPKDKDEFKHYQEMKKTASAISEELDFLVKNLIQGKEDKAVRGIEELDRQISWLNDLNEDDIDANSYFSMGHGGYIVSSGEDVEYFMSKSDAIRFIAELSLIQVIKQVTYITQTLDGLVMLVKAFEPIPIFADLAYQVELTSPTTSILPSGLNGGRGSTEVVNSDDVSSLSATLSQARELVGSEYTQDINNVDPEIRLEEAELNTRLVEAMERLAENLTHLLGGGNASVTNLFSPQNTFLVGLVIALIDMVVTIKQIIEDFIFVISNFEAALQILVKSLGENILINDYALKMFPNRVHSDVPGMTAMPTWSNNALSAQTFSGAQVEYIINGSYSELKNQSAVYLRIFILRIINNIVCVFADSLAMSLVSACNILAPLAFIVWVVYESVVDMNLLINLDYKIPFIKTSLVLSTETLSDKNSIETLINDLKTYGKSNDTSTGYEGKTRIGEDFTDMVSTGDEDKDKEKKAEKGLFYLDYEGYMNIFLFFVPNRTKVMRMADLIQMELRYKQLINGKTVDFLMQEAETYVRVYAEGSYNSILPVISLGNTDGGQTGWTLRTVKYVGY